jgi:hypothetical protein
VQTRVSTGAIALAVVLLLSCDRAVQMRSSEEVQDRKTNNPGGQVAPSQNQEISGIPNELRLPGTPDTARETDCFRRFSNRSSMADVVKKCGLPDEQLGSGIAIFVYHMRDGSTVSVGTPDLKRLFYVYHGQKGKTADLLNREEERSKPFLD